MKSRGIRIRSLVQTLLTAGFLLVVIYYLYVKYNLSSSRNIAKLVVLENNEPEIFSAQSDSFSSDQQIGNKSDIVDFRVIVIVYNRAESLLRLLNSLNDALYFGDKIAVDIWIDKSKEGLIDTKTLQTAKEFNFKHGKSNIYTHVKHVGIYGQWLSTWHPDPASSEIAVILEDDLTVSPYYYKYLKLLHNKYGHNQQINGFALQGVSMKHSGNSGLVEGPKDKYVYMYPTLGTWGFSPNRKNWMSFLEWFSTVYNDTTFQPYVPGHVSTGWYKTFQKTGKVDGMWSMWHIYYAWKNKEFTVYPNFAGHLGLAINHKEAGLHYKGDKTPLDGLIVEWKPEYEQLPETPPELDNSGKLIK